ncbi:uncharacterized protein LOC121413672 [Lytechinus variegatus]|uniref:uncharacterized protein LOC121413672 n=1 Tax=Lytechinus variegatus TaxID=7654 RepID=UPI001BB21532|nr:uncharacterized protein LOC121413672 [Lytechinus variegatus]XP_041462525.1 uncharacterized protein LOC121413672 [Lytechinus variegatus]XP_041462526.1 uncharacterized protein LOC121413672 [Lytechinus variegatus]
MEQLQPYWGVSRRTGRTVKQNGSPTNQIPFYTNARPMTQSVTSPVTRVSCCKSPNRGELTHFCCCLHRRRALLKRWSRRHREKATRLVAGQEDAGSTQQLHIHHSRQDDETYLHSNTSSLIDTSSNSYTNTESYKDDRLLKRDSLNIRLHRDMVLASDAPDRLSRSNFTSSVASRDDGGAKFETPRCQLPSHGAPDEKDHVVFHTRLRPTFPQWTDVRVGRLMFNLVSGVSRAIPSAFHSVRRLTGEAREGRPRGRCESKLAISPAAQMTFHRWVTALLVCIMVLPVNSTAAPGMSRQGSVVEEPGNEPGFKNSYYAELPPKAEYESVIICLLAVSAFIGLIVWVLKSNFEERQQKRMRREASLRERTSSVAFLKT